jgi:multidrug efflux pump subunit AcrB
MRAASCSTARPAAAHAQWRLVPLSAIATVEREVGPRVLSKFQQKNAFRIYGGVLPGTTKEQGLAALEQAAAQLLPASYSIDYAGESRQLRQEGNTLTGILGFALACSCISRSRSSSTASATRSWCCWARCRWRWPVR